MNLSSAAAAAAPPEGRLLRPPMPISGGACFSFFPSFFQPAQPSSTLDLTARPHRPAGLLLLLFLAGATQPAVASCAVGSTSIWFWFRVRNSRKPSKEESAPMELQ